MKICLLLVGILISTGLSAQTTRKTMERPGIKEVFYVLKSDKQIKEGPYSMYTLFGNRLICEGYYKNNLKDSLWKYYSYLNKVAETGYYQNGKKTGIWEAYDYRAILTIKYDFSNKKLLYRKTSPRDSVTKQYTIIKGTDTIKSVLDQPPLYLDGEISMLNSVMYNIRYPLNARNSGTQGKVIVVFWIDAQGNVSNYGIKKGIGSGCDEEALRVVKLIDGDWLPGTLNGQPVTTQFEIPVDFSLVTQ